MNGLIVKEPFATQLVTGKKLTEFRTKPLPNDRIDESIYILNKGKILGTVTFMGSEKMGNLYKWLVLESKEFPVKFGVKLIISMPEEGRPPYLNKFSTTELVKIIQRGK